MSYQRLKDEKSKDNHINELIEMYLVYMPLSGEASEVKNDSVKLLHEIGNLLDKIHQDFRTRSLVLINHQLPRGTKKVTPSYSQFTLKISGLYVCMCRSLL